jgi:hypothetical protein
MNRNAWSAVALAFGLGLLAGPGAADPSLSVYVSAASVEPRKEVDEATKNALKTRRDEASKARKALEKQLKASLGKKRETWPPEKDEELYHLEEAEAIATAEFEYRKIDPKAIGDAVLDLSRAIEGKGLQAGKKDHLTMATAATDADLFVQILARRSEKELGAVVPSHCWVLFTIGPGGKMDPAQFARVPAGYRPRKFLLQAWRLASPAEERPYFTFEGYNGGGSSIGCHGAAANSASTLIDKFAEDNYATLTAP